MQQILPSTMQPEDVHVSINHSLIHKSLNKSAPHASSDMTTYSLSSFTLMTTFTAQTHSLPPSSLSIPENAFPTHSSSHCPAPTSLPHRHTPPSPISSLQ